MTEFMSVQGGLWSSQSESSGGTLVTRTGGRDPGSGELLHSPKQIIPFARPPNPRHGRFAYHVYSRLVLPPAQSSDPSVFYNFGTPQSIKHFVCGHFSIL